jgi:hypothetical protein
MAIENYWKKCIGKNDFTEDDKQLATFPKPVSSTSDPHNLFP